MAHGGGEDEGRLDLVPMIDCIMLLLLFFMMTTKFSSEEKAINSLLPTDKGQTGAATKKDPPKTVNIRIVPAGMQKGYQPSEYLTQLDKMRAPGQVIGNAWIIVGGADPLLVEGAVLRAKPNPQMQAQVDKIHQYIHEALAKYEQPGKSRKDQNEIVVHCFSGLSWKYALLAYDAVRAYEGDVGQIKWTGNPEELLQARGVNFAPPRIRNYAADELGQELFEIVNMK